jgi:hypothetical protein
MADARLHRQRGESREAFARRVQSLAPAFTQLTARHVALAFGSQWVASPQELRGLAQQSQRELSANTKAWKRWLGALTPWTWLRAR